MINQAMVAKQNELNEFTKTLAEQCLKNDNALVKLRNNEIAIVEYHPQETLDETETAHFATPEYSRVWNLDGSSNTSYEFDIIASGSQNFLGKFTL